MQQGSSKYPCRLSRRVRMLFPSKLFNKIVISDYTHLHSYTGIEETPSFIRTPTSTPHIHAYIQLRTYLHIATCCAKLEKHSLILTCQPKQSGAFSPARLCEGKVVGDCIIDFTMLLAYSINIESLSLECSHVNVSVGVCLNS